jgi:hypothetical protein
VNPAVGVHDVQRNFVNNAVNGVTNVLSRGDQERKGDQNDHRRLVVQSEDVVVDAYRVKFQKPLDGAENIKHGAFFLINVHLKQREKTGAFSRGTQKIHLSMPAGQKGPWERSAGQARTIESVKN